VFRHKQQFVHRSLGLLEGRTGLGVKQYVLLFSEGIMTSGNCSCHVNRSLAAGTVVSYENKRFGGMFQHQSHLYVVESSGINFGWDTHAHDEVDVREGVTKPVAVDNVLSGKLAVFPSFGVD
jgi:hypothetical protein